MSIRSLPEKQHEHTVALVHVVLQKAGVPYEVELRMCTVCERVLDERPLKRAAA
jgi:hypothetical protein